MPMTVADLKAFSLRYRVHAECIGVALFAFVAFVGVGVAAKRRLAPVRADQVSVSMVESELSNFRTAFKPEPVGHDVLMALPDSFAISVPRANRVSLAGDLASRAEQVGLRNVRVNFAPPDSSAAPEHPEFFGAPVSVADYGVAVECGGSFAAVLSFVDQLPSSVALQRITAVRDKAGSHFLVMLAVFESAGSAQHG
ncbi:MAG TPA: hypothetical protein VGM67_11905 [Gemmatimonadaceae bacterium]|jgi:hypothetical protein